MTKWIKLEKYTAELLKGDKSRRTPGSGSSKKEEDLVGLSTICQCKDSDHKNITILTKDIERLLASATLLNKTPLFISRAENHTLLSISLDNQYIDETMFIINQILLISQLKLIEESFDYNLDIKTLNALSTQFDILSETSDVALCNLKSRINKLKTKINTKILDANTYNLFGDTECH